VRDGQHERAVDAAGVAHKHRTHGLDAGAEGLELGVLGKTVLEGRGLHGGTLEVLLAEA
jgi:hypothetical protein